METAMKIDGFDPVGKRTTCHIDDHVFAYLSYAMDGNSEAKDYCRLAMAAFRESDGITMSKSVTREILKVIVKPSLRRQFEQRDFQLDIEDF